MRSVASTSVYMTGSDFRAGKLASVALTGTLITLARRPDPASLGPIPRAAKFT
jgi:hypothetical protein